jgi:hypothetical protein
MISNVLSGVAGRVFIQMCDRQSTKVLKSRASASWRGCDRSSTLERFRRMRRIEVLGLRKGVERATTMVFEVSLPVWNGGLRAFRQGWTTLSAAPAAEHRQLQDIAAKLC